MESIQIFTYYIEDAIRSPLYRQRHKFEKENEQKEKHLHELRTLWPVPSLSSVSAAKNEERSATETRGRRRGHEYRLAVVITNPRVCLAMRRLSFRCVRRERERTRAADGSREMKIWDKYEIETKFIFFYFFIFLFSLLMLPLEWKRREIRVTNVVLVGAKLQSCTWFRWFFCASTYWRCCGIEQTNFGKDKVSGASFLKTFTKFLLSY